MASGPVTPNQVVFELYTGSSVSQGAEFGPSAVSGPILPPPYSDPRQQDPQAAQLPILGLIPDVGPSRAWCYLSPALPGVSYVPIPGSLGSSRKPADILTAIGYTQGGSYDQWAIQQIRHTTAQLMRMTAFFYDGTVPWVPNAHGVVLMLYEYDPAEPSIRYVPVY